MRSLFTSKSVLTAALVAALMPMAFSQEDPVRYINSRRPVIGPTGESGRTLPQDANVKAVPPVTTPSAAITQNPWSLQVTLPGTVIHDIHFVTPLVGYAAAELGQVWKTTDGGANWTRIMNLGFPIYWEGVRALSETDVVVTGNNNNPPQGIMSWSHDGGATWSSLRVLNQNGYSERIRFADPNHGLVLDSSLGSGHGHYTSNSGAEVADWTQVTTDPSGGWFGRQFSFRPDLRAVATGINYCSSTDAGHTWSCRPSVDSIFDGEVFFADANNGWVGAGTIYPTVAGWLHVTTDGGASWSGRTLQALWPIREIHFRDKLLGWAAGGDIYSGVGGIYFSTDGGRSWSLDLDSNGYELDACDSQTTNAGYLLWCAGYNHATEGVIYRLQGAATPALLPAPGSYSAATDVTLSTATPGAQIYYTLDGSKASAASNLYTGPVTIRVTKTIRAIAIAAGMAQSTETNATYTLPPPRLSLSGASQSMAGRRGDTVSLSLDVNSSVPLDAPISLSCSGLPQGATCTFTPASVSATSALPARVTLNIAIPSTLANRSHNGTAPIFAFATMPILIALVNGRRMRIALILAGLLLVVLAFAGCGGGASGPAPVPEQNYTISVNASSPGAEAASMQVQLTVR